MAAGQGREETAEGKAEVDAAWEAEKQARKMATILAEWKKQEAVVLRVGEAIDEAHKAFLRDEASEATMRDEACEAFLRQWCTAERLTAWGKQEASRPQDAERGAQGEGGGP